MESCASTSPKRWGIGICGRRMTIYDSQPLSNSGAYTRFLYLRLLISPSKLHLASPHNAPKPTSRNSPHKHGQPPCTPKLLTNSHEPSNDDPIRMHHHHHTNPLPSPYRNKPPKPHLRAPITTKSPLPNRPHLTIPQHHLLHISTFALIQQKQRIRTTPRIPRIR